jgi:hypothetical protein
MLVYQRVYGITNRPLFFSLDIIQDWVDWLVQRDWTMTGSYWIHVGEYIGTYIYTLWLFNIAMENGPFIDGLPI